MLLVLGGMRFIGVLPYKIKQMKKIEKKFEANSLRRTVLDMAYAGSTVHIACAFSIIEILAVLYRSFLRFPQQDCSHLNRDYLVLSKGHGVMAQYACMKELGWLSQSDVDNYFVDGTELKGLSDSRVKGLEVTSGSLGHGLSVGVGLALAAKIKGVTQKTFILVGDGELNEGSIWEGLMFASHSRLSNLMVIVDENGFQAMGRTSDVIFMGSINEKFEAFGFDVLSVDGHDEVALHDSILELWSKVSERPKALIAKTIKGKGVSFMEGNNKWHYTRLDDSNYKIALKELSVVKVNLA
jgi:transketolase